MGTDVDFTTFEEAAENALWSSIRLIFVSTKLVHDHTLNLSAISDILGSRGRFEYHDHDGWSHAHPSSSGLQL